MFYKVNFSGLWFLSTTQIFAEYIVLAFFETYLKSNESIIQDHVDGIVLACVWEPTCWLGWDNYNP